MRTPFVISLLALCFAALAHPQSNPTQYSGVVNLGSTTTDSKMSVEDVVRLSQAGMSDDVIIKQLLKSGRVFDLSTNELIQLRKAGVSDRVIQTMIDPKTPAVSKLPQSNQGSPPQPSQPPSGPVTAEVPAVAESFAGVSSPIVHAPSASRPRVYFSSESKGSQWNAARNQSMEMSKDFEKDCPGVQITVNQSTADYTVLLNHIEHGFVRDNQIQLANKDGDLISRTKEGGSIRGGMKKACEIILADWAKNR